MSNFDFECLMVMLLSILIVIGTTGITVSRNIRKTNEEISNVGQAISNLMVSANCQNKN